jgi:hypothetical protein
MVSWKDTPITPATIVHSSRIRAFFSVGLLNPKEVWVALLHVMGTDADVNMAPTFEEDYMNDSDPIIHLTTA